MTTSPARGLLLDHAVSRLTPGIFSHPVWLRFGKQEASVSLQTADDLCLAAKNLQGEDPDAACQLLLLSAVYQISAGQWFNAFRTTEDVLTISRNNHLAREVIWALWGECAIWVQQGNKEKACSFLVDLQAVLNEQHDWILAGFVDVLRQAFFQTNEIQAGEHSQTPQDPTFEDTLEYTFDWLLHWGSSCQSFQDQDETTSSQVLEHTTGGPSAPRSFFSIQHWRGNWHSLLLAIRGELRLQWNTNHSPSTTRMFSWWGSFLSSVRFYLASRSIDTQVADPVPQGIGPALPPAARESLPEKTVPRRRKAGAAPAKIRKGRSIKKGPLRIPVAVHMLGAFSMTIEDVSIKLPNTRSLSILKYLLVHRRQHVTRDALMDIFWPDSNLETARNSLDVALHGIRKGLRNALASPAILYEDGAYTFAPGLQIWLDVEEFDRCIQAGQQLEDRQQRTSAIAEYEAAISLYQGDYLEQNPYEDWTILDRERLRIVYLDTLDRLSHIYFDQDRYAACIAVCLRILTQDPCREDAHCLMMRCFSRQGQNHLALRQYHICVEVLRNELCVDPAAETTKLYQDILHRGQV
jgi:DNA-binding SARP family transcriptional activator